ncbi:MAG: nucleoside triphosphate pyrophosphohydrolase [Nitrospira sp. SB0662_bin_26]|nr:nucleoside triphosphate pyrophosphohydrolase [Nitrospira sp. SB0662_bin_26]
MEDAKSQAFQDLVNVVARLRSPDGCPWDIKQTHESLKPFLLEEAYEVLEALDTHNPQHLREELGDLLLQILLHAHIESEKQAFTINDVITDLTHKLIRRHPHVFSAASDEAPKLDSEQVVTQWEAIKQAERSTESDSILAGIPASLPSLLRAHQIQKRAARVGFDWETPEQVFEKLDEELEELRAAAPCLPDAGPSVQEPETNAAIEHELGDVLFTIVNVARFLQINPEEALRKANNRFTARFRYMERQGAQEKKTLREMTALEWDTLWEAAKIQETTEGPQRTVTLETRDQDHE